MALSKSIFQPTLVLPTCARNTKPSTVLSKGYGYVPFAEAVDLLNPTVLIDRPTMDAHWRYHVLSFASNVKPLLAEHESKDLERAISKAMSGGLWVKGPVCLPSLAIILFSCYRLDNYHCCQLFATVEEGYRC